MVMPAILYTKTYIACPCCNGESGHMVSQMFNKGPRDFGPFQCVGCRGIFRGNIASNNQVFVEPTTIPKEFYNRYGFLEQKGKPKEVVITE